MTFGSQGFLLFHGGVTNPLDSSILGTGRQLIADFIEAGIFRRAQKNPVVVFPVDPFGYVVFLGYDELTPQLLMFLSLSWGVKHNHIVARGHGSYSSLNIPLNRIVVPSDRLVSGWVERHQQPSICVYIYIHMLYMYCIHIVCIIHDILYIV